MVRTMRSTLEEDVRVEAKMSEPRRCGHYVVLSVVFLMDLMDCVWDWLFFVDISVTKSGLVYGPPNAEVWWSTLFFSVLGSVLFLMETYNAYRDTRHQKPWADPDILSLVVVWFEDIPQVLISFSLALCREEAISIFQLLKAGTVLFSILIRFIILVVNYCTKERKHKHHRKIKVAIIVGALLEGVFSGLVFGLTQSTNTENGVSFQVPTTLIEEEFNERKYFANVSVFVSQPEYFDVGGLEIPEASDRDDRTRSVGNWMRLASVDYVKRRGDGDGLQFSLEYEANATSKTLKMAWWQKQDTSGTGDAPKWTISGCYIVKQGTISEVKDFSNCTRTGFFTESSENVYVTLGYTSPGRVFRGQIFGDITFNARLSSVVQGISVCGRNEAGYNSKEYPLQFRYFQTAPHLPPQGTSHLLYQSEGGQDRSVRLFRNDGEDLIEISEVWKTGWLRCESDGNFSPTLNENIQVDCSRDD